MKRRITLKRAVKYVCNAGPLYMLFKKHFCPFCGNKLELSYVSKIVNSKSPEAADYDFSVGDSFLVGDVEFRTRCFWCANCNLNFSINEIKNAEKLQKK